MSDVKWTAGPWVAVLSHDHIFVDQEDMSEGVAKIMLVKDFDESRMLANAHLISAAPDLFDALLVAREYLQGFVNSTMREPDITNLEVVDAALAKARGETGGQS